MESLIKDNVQTNVPVAGKNGETPTPTGQLDISAQPNGNPDPYEVLVLIFSDFNILDFSGPIEVLSKGHQFHLTVAAQDYHTCSNEAVCVRRDISLEEARQDLARYDVLVVVGGPWKSVIALHSKDNPVARFIEEFESSIICDGNTRVGKRERVIMSICTGSFLLGYLGMLHGKQATTHHEHLERFRAVCEEAQIRDGAKKPTDVVEARFVDCGVVSTGYRLITAGGVSSGMDSALYLVQRMVSVDVAEEVADRLEHRSRIDEGIADRN
ncbi:MAG: hypothetical protein M1829_002375 [Trizodia sp. TS-e1964]|nr:MAG: hypothetical protein M1829_002375 [Trizodia sp. TS-e1964]